MGETMWRGEPFKEEERALARWLSWLGRHPVHQKVAGLIPSRGVYGKQSIEVSLSHQCFSFSLSFFLSLKSINISLGKDLR